MNFTKDEHARRINDCLRKYVAIARSLGEDHPITKQMDSLAWGRSNAERGPDQQSVKETVYEHGYLIGYFDCLNIYARDHDREAQKVMLKIWYDTK